MKRNKENIVQSENFLKCMYCDRESYQAGRFISNNMNLIQILCKEHFIQLLDSQAGISIERFNDAESGAKNE